MNIVASVHLYPPEHNCGAEWMLHFMLKDLQAKGKNVVLINTPVYEKRDKELALLNSFIVENHLEKITYFNFQQSLKLADSSLIIERCPNNSPDVTNFTI